MKARNYIYESRKTISSNLRKQETIFNLRKQENYLLTYENSNIMLVVV
jgi:hypothetical protein